MAARKRLATAADLRALNRNAGPVVVKFAPGAEKGTVRIPAAPRSKPPRGKR